MLSYAVTDRDRERLIEDLVIARQLGPDTVRLPAVHHHSLRKALSHAPFFRTHLAS
jgi:hypothetical protein